MIDTNDNATKVESQTPIQFDYETSKRIAAIIHALPHDCWNNAFKALSHLQGGYYVEGWLVCDGIPFEHGWCELNGAVVEPTLYDRLGKNILYCPGIKYSFDEVFRSLKKKGISLPLVWITGGFGGMQNKAYREAQQRAFRACNFQVVI